LDGAHNQDAAAVLGENLRQYRSKGKCFGILHIFKDKEAAGILSELSDIFDKIWLPRTEMARSLPPEELQSLCQRYLPHTDCVLAESVEAAAIAAKEEAGTEDSIVVFGSLSHLETARKALIRIDEVVRND
jgi:folylpolyglutamate synthase/dihydropteroate synthase